MTTKGEHASESNQAGQAATGFLQQIQHAGLLRSTVAASDLASGVFCTLLLTVPREQARSFLSAMPPTLRSVFHVCAVERREEAEIVGREQVLRVIADRLRIEPEDAELVARIVLAAAQNWLPRKELQQLRLVSPPELRDLWAAP